MEWSTRQHWQRDAAGRLELQRNPRTGVLQGVSQGWWAGWTCHGCHREVSQSEISVNASGAACPNGCGPRMWVQDFQSGSATWQCSRSNCATRGPLRELPAFFTCGPLCSSDRIYGWGSPPLAVPGNGTQSWLFCPLISLGLLSFELESSLQPWSIGCRAVVPSAQARFWQGSQQARTIIAQYAAHFQSPAGQSALRTVSDPVRWRTHGGQVNDHLSGADQEFVTPQHLTVALEVLTVELATWTPEVADSPPENSRRCGDCREPTCRICACLQCRDGSCAACMEVHIPRWIDAPGRDRSPAARSISPTSPAFGNGLGPVDALPAAMHTTVPAPPPAAHPTQACEPAQATDVGQEVRELRREVAALRALLPEASAVGPLLSEIRDLLVDVLPQLVRSCPQQRQDSHALGSALPPPPWPPNMVSPREDAPQGQEQQQRRQPQQQQQQQQQWNAGDESRIPSDRRCTHSGCNRTGAGQCPMRACALHCTSASCSRHTRRRARRVREEAPPSQRLDLPEPPPPPAPQPPPPMPLCSFPSCRELADGACPALRCSEHCTGCTVHIPRTRTRPEGSRIAHNWSGTLWHRLQEALGPFDRMELQSVPGGLREHIAALQAACSGEDAVLPRQRTGWHRR